MEEITYWYDDRDELYVLLDWMAEQLWAASELVRAVEKPWAYEEEWELAKAIRDHEFANPGHRCWPADEEYWVCDAGSAETYDPARCQWQWTLSGEGSAGVEGSGSSPASPPPPGSYEQAKTAHTLAAERMIRGER